MSTLISIPSGHMRFIPADKQADDESMELKPAKWPVELIIIANELGREAYLDEDRVRTILGPAIQSTCRLRPENTNFFPPPLQPRHNTSYRTGTFPKRPLPYRPATGHTSTCAGPQTPPQGLGPESPHRADKSDTIADSPYSPALPQQGYISSQRLPDLHNAPPLNRDGHHPPANSGGHPPYPLPMGTEIHPRKLDLHGWLRHCRPSQIGSSSGTHSHLHHRLHRCSRKGGNSHYHAR